jgi:hypothetical protein
MKESESQSVGEDVSSDAGVDERGCAAGQELHPDTADGRAAWRREAVEKLSELRDDTQQLTARDVEVLSQSLDDPLVEFSLSGRLTDEGIRALQEWAAEAQDSSTGCNGWYATGTKSVTWRRYFVYVHDFVKDDEVRELTYVGVDSFGAETTFPEASFLCSENALTRVDHTAEGVNANLSRVGEYIPMTPSDIGNIPQNVRKSLAAEGFLAGSGWEKAWEQYASDKVDKKGGSSRWAVNPSPKVGKAKVGKISFIDAHIADLTPTSIKSRAIVVVPAL